MEIHLMHVILNDFHCSTMCPLYTPGFKSFTYESWYRDHDFLNEKLFLNLYDRSMENLNPWNKEHPVRLNYSINGLDVR